MALCQSLLSSSIIFLVAVLWEKERKGITYLQDKADKRKKLYCLPFVYKMQIFVFTCVHRKWILLILPHIKKKKKKTTSNIQTVHNKTHWHSNTTEAILKKKTSSALKILKNIKWADTDISNISRIHRVSNITNIIRHDYSSDFTFYKLL